VRGYTVVLNIGDNLSDWLPQFSSKVGYQQRVNNLMSVTGSLGRDFILMPNPMYGSWLKALKVSYKDNYEGTPPPAVTEKESPRLSPLRFPALPPADDSIP
jgi:predicted secreted acid phosphatase